MILFCVLQCNKKINITLKVRIIIILISSQIQYTSHFRSVINEIRRSNVKYLPTPLSLNVATLGLKMILDLSMPGKSNHLTMIVFKERPLIICHTIFTHCFKLVKYKIIDTYRYLIYKSCLYAPTTRDLYYCLNGLYYT